MSAKRYKLPELEWQKIIRKARKTLKEMPMRRKIELMVEAGLLTPKQADRAKKKLAENNIEK